MNHTVTSNSPYIVSVSAAGLTRSPPGVATAAKYDAEDHVAPRRGEAGGRDDVHPR